MVGAEPDISSQPRRPRIYGHRRFCCGDANWLRKEIIRKFAKLCSDARKPAPKRGAAEA